MTNDTETVDTYRHLRVAAQVVKATPKKIVIKGIAHDLEYDVYAEVRVTESFLASDGKTPFCEDTKLLIAQVALKKAIQKAVAKLAINLIHYLSEETANERD